MRPTNHQLTYKISKRLCRFSTPLVSRQPITSLCYLLLAVSKLIRLMLLREEAVQHTLGRPMVVVNHPIEASRTRRNARGSNQLLPLMRSARSGERAVFGLWVVDLSSHHGLIISFEDAIFTECG
jgi:hypothetical protein